MSADTSPPCCWRFVLLPERHSIFLTARFVQDAHVMQLGVPGHKDVSWFGVFDGHGGDLVSQES